MKHLIPLLIATLVSHLATAQAPPAASDRPRYVAQWYATFAPRTALDMVRQTPGFTLAEGETDRRGLSGAVGNVLIDGRRPSAKEQTIEEILQRIPAGQVLAIELLRGADTAGDSSGQSVLLNVVRTPFTGAGVGSLGFEYAQQHEPAPNGWMSWTGRARSIDYEVGASTYSLARELPGTRRLLDVDGMQVGTRRDSSPRDFGEYALNGEAGMDIGAGRLKVTGQAYYSRYHEDSRVASFDAGGAPLGADFNPYTESKRSGEFGGHFDRTVGAWQLATVALLTRTRFESDIVSSHSDAGGVVDSVFAQQLAHDSGESILRGALSRVFAAHRLEFGVEAALNTLDADLALTFDSGGGPFPIPVPNSNVRIEEQRYEAFVDHAWQLNPRWSLDWRLAGEYSRLVFSGDSNQVVTLSFVKPALQFTRKFGAANQLRFRIVRDVGQLDFTAFVSSAALADERIDGGNPDLKPQTQWSAEVTADLRPGKDFALSLGAFHRWVSDTADFTPVGPPEALVDSPGNIGAARVYGVQLAGRAPLRVLRGASVNLDATWQQSSVTDPLTLREREISKFEKLALTAGFRQDLPSFAWGLSYVAKPRTSAYLLREIERNRASASLDAFVEMPLPRGLRLHFDWLSLLGQEQTRDRMFFDPDRRAGAFTAERSERLPGHWFQLNVSGSF